MKKSIKKSSRRKWVVGGVAFFGSIALLTTGFATWVVGVNDNNENNTVNVKVETTENASVSFTMAYASGESADNTITIDEPDNYSYEGKKIINPGEGKSKFDFTVTFESVNITIGHAAQEDNDYDGIEFAITGTNNEIQSAGNKLGTARSGSSWTYLAAPATKTFEQLGLTDKDGTSAITWTGSNVEIAFDWGNFFGGKTPCTYYNTLYNDGNLATIGDDSAIVDAIYSEMSAMQTAFTTTNTITLTATLVDTTPSA